MKCEIAKDLIPLYVEGMCSEETVTELNEHMQGCEKCRAMLENCKAEIVVEDSTASSDAKDAVTVDSMKKVKRKLRLRKLGMVILGLFLAAVIIGNGILIYGELSGRSINYTTLNNLRLIRNMCDEVCKGNLDPIVERTSLDYTSVYALTDTINASYPDMNRADGMRALQKEKLQLALQEHFGNEPFKYRIDGMEYAYDNDLKSGVSEDLSLGYRNPAAIITVAFYNEKRTMFVYFTQMADRKFNYTSDVNAPDETDAQFCSLSQDDLIHTVFATAIARRAAGGECTGSILAMCVRYDKESREFLQKDSEQPIVRTRAEALFEKGYNVTEFWYTPSGIEKDHYFMTYDCMFKIENAKGDYVIIKQTFADRNAMFVMNGYYSEPVASSEGVPDEIREAALGLFAPVK